MSYSNVIKPAAPCPQRARRDVLCSIVPDLRHNVRVASITLFGVEAPPGSSIRSVTIHGAFGDAPWAVGGVPVTLTEGEGLTIAVLGADHRAAAWFDVPLSYEGPFLSPAIEGGDQ